MAPEHERMPLISPKGLTLASALATRATSDPESPYVRLGSTAMSYGEVESQSEALAASLAGLGIGPGERVVILLPACTEFVVTTFALAKLGAVIVPLNPHLGPGELQYILRHSEAGCAVIAERVGKVEYLEVFEQLLSSLPELKYLVTVGDEELWYDDRIYQYEDVLSAGAGRDYEAPGVEPEACVALVYTSGTMGKPKGVELSHASLLYAAAGLADAAGLGPSDRVIGVLALHHVFALGPGLLGTLLAGASLILQEDGTGAEVTLELAEEHGATVHYGVPTVFVAELEALQRRRSPPGLRVAVVSGAPVREDLVAAMRRALVPTVLAAYSLTETSSAVSVSRVDDPPEKQLFTVGRPIAGTELKIVESDGTALPVESVGEIAVRGPGLMLRYYRQPQETKTVFDEEGYLLTGDLGILDEEGYLHLVGRRKDVIIRSGFNVYPREVEARIESHPAVHEVAVVGLPDKLLGEAICACVVPVEGAIVTGQDIVEWCRETLAEEKLPDTVRFFDELPHTDTGQVRRVGLTRLLGQGRPA